MSDAEGMSEAGSVAATLTAGQAFDVLRQASQRRNIKLSEIAERLVETGEQLGLEP